MHIDHPPPLPLSFVAHFFPPPNKIAEGGARAVAAVAGGAGVGAGGGAGGQQGKKKK